MRTPRPTAVEKQAPPNFWRDRIASLVALATFMCLSAAFLFCKSTQFLMPGPLTSAHGTIETCSACHAKNGQGKMSWIRGLVAGERRDDSKACLTCHKMPETAFNAHSASTAVLKQSTERLTKVAAATPVPQSARAQNVAFPIDAMATDGLPCATCHQEHQGINFKLNKISNDQCRSCHVVKFDSFDGNHPQFEGYPFKRRTRIIYDHAGHFGKHFPEVAKKDLANRIPATCSTCHTSSDDKRIMTVAPFERTCTVCHLDQITGKERASGPKGVAFLTLPGLDLSTLKKKNALIGEWPDSSEANLTPFMKLMISRSEPGRSAIKATDGLNLQELAQANDNQIKAVTTLVWEVKTLFHAMISGKASDVLGDLTFGGGAKLSAALVTDLTASIPRDVVISAQQQWLPNLAKEMASHSATRDQKQTGWSPVTTETPLPASAPHERTSGADVRRATQTSNPQANGSNPLPAETPSKANQIYSDTEVRKETRAADQFPPAMRAGILVAENDASRKGGADNSDAADTGSDGDTETPSANEHGGGRTALPSGTSRAIEARSKGADKPERPKRTSGKADGVSDMQPRQKSPSQDAETAPQPAPPADATATVTGTADGGNEAPSADPSRESKTTDQTDDLLFPTEAELRANNALTKDAEKAAPSEGAAAKSDAANGKVDSPVPTVASDGPRAPNKAAVEPHAVTPAISIESEVDPESWAEFGGWYRQDYAIFYRPTGHKDKFIYSWLVMSGPKAPKGDTGPAAAVFDDLTSKDAQGSCTKCHSVDDEPGKGRVVNFSPPSGASKQGQFTNFIHEPHFGVMENRGCLTCHELEKGRPYLKSYEQGNPQSFASNFGEVKKDLCQTCHASSKARQDCLTCHKYHVNGVMTPIMATKIPTQ